jgi:prepilin-type N-terminal cleavage/methylation domain-containing protein
MFPVANQRWKMKAKGIFTHLSEFSANNKGLTLIELIVSIAILAIVTGPFLGTIILSTRNNTYSEQVLKASELAQNAMEEIKSKPDFLENEAVYEAEAQTTDYKEYLQKDGYRVRYKIIKHEGTV